LPPAIELPQQRVLKHIHIEKRENLERIVQTKDEEGVPVRSDSVVHRDTRGNELVVARLVWDKIG
jgi:hypothetical protein